MENIRTLKEHAIKDKQTLLDLIKFYNSKLDTLERSYSIYYILKKNAVDRVLECDIDIMYYNSELEGNDE